MRYLVRLFRSLPSLVILAVLLYAPAGSVFALTDNDIQSIRRGTVFYNPEFTVSCAVPTLNTTTDSTNTNLDYAGNEILNSAQLEQISKNQAFYEEAANQVDIPWQMIAVIHLRESGGSRENPNANAEGGFDGIYQITGGTRSEFPPGPVSDEEFLRQTIVAAEFIKNKASSNYPGNKELTKTSNANVIKDTFFGYNGRAEAYEKQAVALGYSEDQGYEGSPYVMNKADAARDPNTATEGTWGQFKGNRNSQGAIIEYPANDGYGAFVMYAVIAGISLDGNCSSTRTGPIRDRVISIARQELALWESGQMKPNGTDYHKYTYGSDGNWCAWFVSWVFNDAGYPVTESVENGVEAAVINLRTVATENARFTWHDAAGYTPVPGDIVVQLNNGKSHTVIVVAVDGDNITVIGGNQGYSDGATTFTNSKVSEYTFSGSTGDSTTGYLSPVE